MLADLGSSRHTHTYTHIYIHKIYPYIYPARISAGNKHVIRYKICFAEFCEAIVRIAVLWAHPKAEDLEKLFSTVKPEVVLDATSKILLRFCED